MRYSASEISKSILRSLSSTNLTIVLLSFLCLIYLVGTIFPQGVSLDDYTKAGGKFLFFAKYFSVLNIFNSWFMFVIVSLLFVNLMLCTVDRIKGSKELTKISSLLYHLVFLLMILMLFISNKVSMEGEIQVNEGETKEIELKTGDKIKLYLSRFFISYTEVPEYIKQNGFLNRLKVVLFDKEGQRIIKSDKFYKSYREFTADIKVNYNGRDYKHLLRINNSLVFSSYSINLYSFEHSIILKINDITYNIKSGDEFFSSPSMQYKLSEVFAGNFLRPDGSLSVLEPEIYIYKKTEEGIWNNIGQLKRGVPVNINGISFEFVDYVQSVIFGIKYDSTVPIMKILSFLSIFLMFSVIINKIRDIN